MVDVPDFVDALGELPAVSCAPVTVVIDAIVQLGATVAEADDFGQVGAAGGGVAVDLNRAGVRA
jgi:hypothetical protein